MSRRLAAQWRRLSEKNVTGLPETVVTKVAVRDLVYLRLPLTVRRWELHSYCVLPLTLASSGV
jgi:hypothetical protein